MALLALLVLTPLTALVSDRVGRKPMFLAYALGFALLSYPLFVGMRSGTFTSALLASLLFAFCSSLSVGCLAATLVELFPTRTRYTDVAIGYNLGQALLGGTAPLVATALIHLSDNVLAPAYYLIASGIVAGIACLFIKARHNAPLDELEENGYLAASRRRNDVRQPPLGSDSARALGLRARGRCPPIVPKAPLTGGEFP
jgi:MHS family proline/betaine transporter-like MFS transporter